MNVVRSCILNAFLLLLVLPSFAQNKKELEKKKAQIQKEISATNELLNETKKNKKLSLNQLVALNQKIGMREELIATISSEVNSINLSIDKTNTGINNLKKEIEKLKAEYAAMIYAAYKNQGAYNKLMFIFSAQDFNQAYNRLKYFEQYAEYRKKQALIIQKTQENLNAKLAELQAKRSELRALLGEKEEEKNTLTTEKGEKEEVLMQLQEKEGQLKADLQKKQEDANRLQREIRKIIEEEIKKAREEAALAAKAAKEKNKANNKNKNVPPEKNVGKEENKEENKENKEYVLTLTPEAQKLSESFELNKGKLPWPVTEGLITGPFGEHEHPVLKGIKVKNDGIDISTKPGSQVRAIFDGEVTGVISIPGAGKAVIIRHGEYLSVYSNLSEATVQKGNKVKTKQNLGTALTDEDNKTSMELQIWKGSVLLNPTGWIYKTE
jgi:septal ring factor EnvC (AmiA/AmiB activator)